MTSENLPRFERPPVVETVLGVQFDRLAGFHNGHLGSFWNKLGPEWTKVTDAPPLEPQSEIFGKAKGLSGLLQLKLRQDSSARLQIRNEAEDRMIQVQNGRFHYNWLGHGGEPYPSYAKVWEEFRRHLDLFGRFVLEQGLGAIQPNLWEVTYVNHIPRGSAWHSPGDWAKLFRLELPPAQPAGTTLETVSGEWQYVIPGEKGRLYVRLQHGELEGTEKVLLTLAARGTMTPKDDLRSMLEIGHRMIVIGFKDLTSEQAHAYWGLMHG
ncbi:MAG: TIGR04255 family protein [Planctomycetes bacterium]|nr:TIGR04255 family protein [Planctomycetota bacterium]